MNIQEAKAREPWLSSMSDVEAVNAIQRNFYPDLTVEQVGGALGVDMSKAVPTPAPASAPEAHGVPNHYTTCANRHSRNNQFMSKFVYFHYKRIVGKKQEKTEKSTIFHGPDCAGTASLKQYLSYRIIMITNDYQKK